MLLVTFFNQPILATDLAPRVHHHEDFEETYRKILGTISEQFPNIFQDTAAKLNKRHPEDQATPEKTLAYLEKELHGQVLAGHNNVVMDSIEKLKALEAINKNYHPVINDLFGNRSAGYKCNGHEIDSVSLEIVKTVGETYKETPGARFLDDINLYLAVCLSMYRGMYGLKMSFDEFFPIVNAYLLKHPEKLMQADNPYVKNMIDRDFDKLFVAEYKHLFEQ